MTSSAWQSWYDQLTFEVEAIHLLPETSRLKISAEIRKIYCKNHKLKVHTEKLNLKVTVTALNDETMSVRDEKFQVLKA